MNYQAVSAPLVVVSCVCEHGIIRAITHSTPRGPFGGWTWPREQIDLIIAHVGRFNLADTEWTAAIYGLPYYVSSDASAYDVPGGVYLYKWVHTTVASSWQPAVDWRDPERRISAREPELLHRPRGWSLGRRARTGKAS